MKYIADGSVITNRLIFTDGRVIEDIMGGSGMYAFAALRQCTPDSMLLSGVGEDFEKYYGEWFNRNNCTRDGLYVRSDKTIYNELVYDPEGKYIEYSIYGDEYEFYNIPEMIMSAKDYEPFISEVKGISRSSGIDEEFEKGMLEYKKKYDFKLMWEIPESQVDSLGESFRHGGMDEVKERLKIVDIFSCNKPESYRIFGTDNVEDSVKMLKQLDRPVYFRVGSAGACMIDEGKEYFVPMISSVPREQEIDPTGCGNSSTAAAMWAYCEGYDPLMCCIIGNVIASYNVRQYGPYPDMSEKTQKETLELAQTIYKKMTQG